MNRTVIEATSFGSVVVLWSGAGGAPLIVRILLSDPEARATDRALRLCPDSRPASCAAVDSVKASLQAFLEGDDVSFSLDLVDLGRCSAFQVSVLRAEHAIPRGAVSTYALLAARVGRPNGARAAGSALATNPFPLIVPCHRAVRSDRSLGGFQGGTAMKRALLEQEGIAFDHAGRVACERFHSAEATV